MSFMGPKPSWYGNIGTVFKIFVHWSIHLLGLKISVPKKKKSSSGNGKPYQRYGCVDGR